MINVLGGDDDLYLSFFRDRLNKMRAKRQPYDAKWTNYETQTNAVSFYDNEGTLNVDVPLEKTLKEIYMGRTDGKIPIDIVPDGQANVEELQPSKYAMMFFMDWNQKDTFWKENRYLRECKTTYGSGIFYTGIRSYKDFRYVPKKDVTIENETDILSKSKFDKVTNETWFFFPKAIHPKDFFIDDAAYGDPDIQKADDCIMKERLTAIEFENRYGKNKAFKNLDQVTYWTDINPRNKNDVPVDVRQIILYHYYHRITKTYLIVANEQVLIYNGLYLYNDGKLPFVNVQHYTNLNRFWGEWIPERIGYLKAYKSEIFQDILTGAAMSSGVNLLIGNDDQLGQDWSVWGRKVNLWRTTGWVENIQNVSTSPNLWYLTTVLQMIDREIATDSGINPNEQFEAPTDKLGIMEIMEANKSVRNRSVDENYNIGIDEALTMMLDRIKQFAPALLSEKVKDSDGRVIKTIFPKIRIDWFTVEKVRGQQVFTEEMGKFGYFELKPDVIQGIGVKVVTPSTNSSTPVLERAKFTEYMNNIMSFANLWMALQDPEIIQKIKDQLNPEQLMEWMNDAFGYDQQSLKANTQKDKIKAENLRKIEAIQQLLSNTPTNETNPMATGQNPAAQASSTTSGANPTATAALWQTTMGNQNAQVWQGWMGNTQGTALNAIGG